MQGIRKTCGRMLTWSPGLFLAATLVLAAGCNIRTGKPKRGDEFVRPQDILAFDRLYRENCQGCHGEDGRRGPAPPLHDKLFLALVSEGDLERIVADGRQGTLMPAFATASGGTLTTPQVKALAKGMKQKWGSKDATPKNAPPYRSASEASRAAGSKQEGLKVFARACAPCHGEDGTGLDGVTSGALNDPNFLALTSDQVLRRIIITGRPDLGMPDYAGTSGRPEDFKPLTDKEVTDLVALLASWRQSGPARGKGK